MLSALDRSPGMAPVLASWGPPAPLSLETVHVVRSALTLIKGWAEYGVQGLGRPGGPAAARAGRALAQVILAADALATAVDRLATPPARGPRSIDGRAATGDLPGRRPRW